MLPHEKKATDPQSSGTFDDERAAAVEIPPIGAVIDRTYRVERVVGRGGMGVVLLATDMQLDRQVAIKLIGPKAGSRDGARRRFLTEARAMANIRHQNVVQIYAYGEHEGSSYFVMEYVPGTSLVGWLIDHRERDVLPSVDEIIGILEQVCRGLGAIHAAGIIHGDVKPGNVLLGPAFRAALTDFGLMRWLGQTEHATLVVGTPAYIPPEVVTSDDPELKLTLGADVYGLGVTAYEMLTGEVPYPIETVTDLFAIHGEGIPLKLPSELRPDLPPAFDDVLIRALAREPSERFRTPDEFRRALLAARAATSKPAGSLRVLIADDDEDFRDLTEAVLRAEFPNATIESVADGQSALGALDRRRASLAVIDLDMPRMNGVELTAAIRASHASKELPIIVVTGHGGAPDWGLLSQLGADGFLVKPLDPYELVALARRVLDRRGML